MSVLRTDGGPNWEEGQDFHQQKTSSKSSMITKGGLNLGDGEKPLTSDTRIQIKQLSQGPPSPKETVEWQLLGQTWLVNESDLESIGKGIFVKGESQMCKKAQEQQQKEIYQTIKNQQEAREFGKSMEIWDGASVAKF